MANKIKVLTNLSASQDVIVKNNTITSGSKHLSTNSSFNNIPVLTSSDGMYNMNSAIHGVDTGLTTLKNEIKDAYNLVKAVLTGALDANGNKKINLTTTITSGSLYFNTASLTNVEASILIDEGSNSIYKNDLVSLQLFNSASYLWVEIDAPAAINDSYSLIVKNQSIFPLAGSVGGSGGSGNQEGGGGGGGENLYIIFPPITTPTGSVNESVSGEHEGYYFYPDVSGNVTIVLNDFSASVSDGGIAFYVMPDSYTGSVTYNPTTDVIETNDFERIITLAGDVDSTNYTNPPENQFNIITPGEEYTVVMPDLTSSVVNDGNTVTVTIPVGTGSAVYVDTYSNNTPTTYDINWSGGVYSNSGNPVAAFIPTYVTGGYWVGADSGSGGDFSGSVDNVLTSSQGKFYGSQFGARMIIIKPPVTNTAGQTISDVVIRWYGGGPVAANRAWDLYNPNIAFYWGQYGTWDTAYTNSKQITSFFVSADYVPGVNISANRNLTLEPVVTYLGGAPLGKDGYGTGHIVIVAKGQAIIEWEYIYS